MDKKNILLIGYGNMGKIHKRVIEDNQSTLLSGVVDLDIEKLNLLNSETRLYSNLNEVDFKSNLNDGAIISSNTSSHYEISKTLIKNNIPFLVEKPLSTDRKQLNEIISTVKSNGHIIRCGILETYNPIFQYIKKLNIKKIKSIHIFRHSQKIIDREVDNVIFDLVIHDFSVLLKLFPDSKIEIISKNQEMNNAEIESVDIFLRVNNIPILISASRESQTKLRKWSIKTGEEDYEIDLINKEVNIFESGAISLEEGSIISNNIKNTKKSFSNSKEAAQIQLEEFVGDIDKKKLDITHLELLEKTHNEIFRINEFN